MNALFVCNVMQPAGAEVWSLPSLKWSIMYVVCHHSSFVGSVNSVYVFLISVHCSLSDHIIYISLWNSLLFFLIFLCSIVLVERHSIDHFNESMMHRIAPFVTHVIFSVFFSRLACVAEFGLNKKKKQQQHTTKTKILRNYQVEKNKQNVWVQMRACWSFSFSFLIHSRKHCENCTKKTTTAKKAEIFFFFSFFCKAIKSMNIFLMIRDSNSMSQSCDCAKCSTKISFLLCVCVSNVNPTVEFIYKAIVSICSEIHCLIAKL